MSATMDRIRADLDARRAREEKIIAEAMNVQNKAREALTLLEQIGASKEAVEDVYAIIREQTDRIYWADAELEEIDRQEGYLA